MTNGFGLKILLLLTVVANRADAAPRPVEPDVETLRAVRDVDMRMARIGHGLAAANAPLCTRLQPDTGLVLHTLDSYTSAMAAVARRYFRFEANLAVAGMVSGSAAARAGLVANDSIIAVNGQPIGGGSQGQGTLDALIASDRQFAALSPTNPIVVSIIRDQRPYTHTLLPQAACRARFELRVSPTFDASSDGEMVQIGTRFFATLNDRELAVLIAHELAHNILEHPRRLAAAGIEGGMLAGFARNVGYFRQTETQADILSVALLVNAGYPADSAASFWHSAGRRVFGAAFTSRSHPSWKDRAATTAAEARRLAGSDTTPVIPKILASRDRPLDGNWQAILVRAGNQ